MSHVDESDPADAAQPEPPQASDETQSAPAASTPRMSKRGRELTREIVETAFLALLVFLCMRASCRNYQVEGDSMFPTLEDGEFLIVNKLAYTRVDMEKLNNFVPFVDDSPEERNLFGGPKRGDIIVFHDPRLTGKDLVKRVIAVPGETIEIVRGQIYINGRLLDEPYIKQTWVDSRQKILAGPDDYYVLGDNRNESFDSREIGLIPRKLIVGKALVTWWPRDKFGLAPNESPRLADEVTR